jgi:hypothetical protein
MNKEMVICLLLFLIGQTMVWFQLNGQFLWDVFKKYESIVILSGIPITWVFLVATRYGYTAFDGLLWPQRFLAFSGGIIIFSLFTWLFKGEGISTKTFICLALSCIILFIQVLWKP